MGLAQPGPGTRYPDGAYDLVLLLALTGINYRPIKHRISAIRIANSGLPAIAKQNYFSFSPPFFQRFKKLLRKPFIFMIGLFA